MKELIKTNPSRIDRVTGGQDVISDINSYHCHRHNDIDSNISMLSDHILFTEVEYSIMCL